MLAIDLIPVRPVSMMAVFLKNGNKSSKKFGKTEIAA